MFGWFLWGFFLIKPATENSDMRGSDIYLWFVFHTYITSRSR